MTIDRSTCDARRHGDMSAYRQGCRCHDAREDHRRYYKRAREGRPYRRLIDATGTRRRLQALFAVGHTSQTVADHTGINPIMVQALAAGRRPNVYARSAQAVLAAYRQLAGQPGTSEISRRRARAHGYLPPHWWVDEAEMDDPNVDPLAEPDPDLVDEVAVDRALAGDGQTGRRLTAAERAHAVQVGRLRGMHDTRLAELLGTHTRTIRTLAANQAA